MSVIVGLPIASELSLEAQRVDAARGLVAAGRLLWKGNREVFCGHLVALGRTAPAPLTWAEAEQVAADALARAYAERQAAATREGLDAPSLAAVAARHGVGESTLRRWVATDRDRQRLERRRSGPAATRQEAILRDLRAGGAERIDVLASIHGTAARQAIDALLTKRLVRRVRIVSEGRTHDGIEVVVGGAR